MEVIVQVPAGTDPDGRCRPKAQHINDRRAVVLGESLARKEPCWRVRYTDLPPTHRGNWIDGGTIRLVAKRFCRPVNEPAVCFPAGCIATAPDDRGTGRCQLCHRPFDVAIWNDTPGLDPTA